MSINPNCVESRDGEVMDRNVLKSDMARPTALESSTLQES